LAMAFGNRQSAIGILAIGIWHSAFGIRHSAIGNPQSWQQN
jgi:hypothetical protein